jgi:hypothetical protein
MKFINIKDKFDKTNLSYVLNYEETTIIMAFTNNIKINFSKYLNQYMNEICNVPRIHIISDIKHDRNRHEYSLVYIEELMR